MLKDIYILITSQDGESAVAIKQPFYDEEGINLLRGEPYLLNRLIKDAETAVEIKAEMARPIGNIYDKKIKV